MILEINEVTGEVIKRKQRDIGWFKGYNKMFEQMAIDKRMDGTDRRVLTWCIGKMGYGNIIEIHQSRIAKILEIDRSMVSRSLKNLCDYEYMELIEKGIPSTYRVSPKVAYKGYGKKNDINNGESV